jgi:hypothetical protein
MTKHIALWMMIATFAGCAGPTGLAAEPKPGQSIPAAPSSAAIGSGATCVGSGSDAHAAKAADDQASQTQPFDPEDVDLRLSGVNAIGGPVALGACRLFARNPGDFTNSRVEPGCFESSDGVTLLPVDRDSEVAFSIGTVGSPNYLTQVTTSSEALDLSGTPYRLLATEQIAAVYATAGVAPVALTSAVVVETAVQGGSYELLLYTTDQGPAPIYLDAEANPAPSAKTSFANGWAVFPNVPMGIHAVSFGHPSESLELAPGMGWADYRAGNTLIWVLPDYATLVAGIEPASGL